MGTAPETALLLSLRGGVGKALDLCERFMGQAQNTLLGSGMRPSRFYWEGEGWPPLVHINMKA